jgi:protein gp37
MTKIEWTEHTWNPIVGCSIVSPGCTNCYAMKMARRLEYMNVPHYVDTTKIVNDNPVWTGHVAMAPDSVLLKPIRRKNPTMYFVNSMGDLFHEDIPDEWIDRVFAVMALAPQHTFQVLTKRAERMRSYVDATCLLYSRATRNEVELAAERIRPNQAGSFAPKYSFRWPLPNVWLGVSAERQQEANERIPLLQKTPAHIRFVSCEPLLEAIELDDLVQVRSCGAEDHHNCLECDVAIEDDQEFHGATIDWVICGGESGPGARPMHPDWARALRDQCRAANVPFFFKQWGEWLPSNDDVNFGEGENWAALHFPGRRVEQHSSGHTFVAVGKKRAGRLLDGRTHDAMPAPRAQEVAA